METQCGDAADTVSSGAVADSVTDEDAETPTAIGDISTFTSQPYYSYDSPCQSRNSRNVAVLGENTVADLTFYTDFYETMMMLGVRGVCKYMTMNKQFV